MRCVPGGDAVACTAPPRVPFAIFGSDHSVILETFKRGDLDSDAANGKRTIVLRLYEAYGGHASVFLQVNVPGVVAVFATNLLEDDEGAEELGALDAPKAGTPPEELPLTGGIFVPLSFRGFEVKTIKLVLAKEG